MAYSLDTIVDSVFEFLVAAAAPTKVYEDYIPDSTTLRRNKGGDVNPYYVVQFGDPQSEGSRSMVGPKSDDYGLPIYIQAIAPSAKLSRQMGNRITHKILGESFPWAGNIRKRPGFNMFTIDSSSGAIEAYAAPRFFNLTVQIEDPIT